MKLFLFCISFSFTFLTCLFSYGQDSETKTSNDSSFRYTYLNVGMGLASREGIEAFASIVGELGTVRNGNIFSSRVWLNRDILRYIEKESDPTKSIEKMTEIGFLYGRYFPFNKFALTVNIGLSYCSGIVRGKWVNSGITGYKTREYLDFREGGIPFKLEMLLGKNLKSNTSIASFAFLATLNTLSPYYGISFCFRFSNERRILRQDRL